MATLGFEILALLLYAPFVVLLHELGHAAFARLGGFRVTSFGVGLGAPVWRTHLPGGVVLHVDRWFLAGGACCAIPVAPPSARRAWFHAGGLIAQAALAVVLLVLPAHWLVDRVQQLNLLVALTNALPWRTRDQASDGWFLLDLLSGRRRSSWVGAQRGALAAMARRQVAIGAPIGAVYARLCTAWADLLVGERATATALFTEDPPHSTLDPWVDALWHYVKSEWHRQERRPLAAIATARAGAHQADHERGLEAAALLALAEARALVDLDATPSAQRALAKVSGVGGAVGLQAAAIFLLSCHDAPDDALQHATWRVARHTHDLWLDPLDAIVGLAQAAETLAARGQRPAADGARLAAADLARRTLRLVDRSTRAQMAARIRAATDLPLLAVGA